MGKDNRTNTYQTANDLKAIMGQVSTSVNLLGKDAPNDGFAGTFFWDENSTLPEDNINVIQRIGVSTGRWVRATGPELEQSKEYTNSQISSLTTGIANAEFTTDPAGQPYQTYRAVDGAGTYVNFLDENGDPIELTTDDFDDMLMVNLYTTDAGVSWTTESIELDIDLEEYMKKDDYLQKSKNLININASDVSLGTQLDTTGNTTVSATLNTTGRFAVEPSTAYTFSPRVRFVAWYNSAGTFIPPLVSITGTTLPSTLTSYANAAFSRSTHLQTVWPLAQAEKGTSFTGYESFGSYIKPSVIKLTSSQVTSIADLYYRKLVDKITKNDTAYLTQSKNLFNYKTVTDGKQMSNGGQLVDNATYCISAPIPLTVGQSYHVQRNVAYGDQGARQMCYFNSSNVVVAGAPNSSFTDFTVPANVAYAILTVAVAYKDQMQLEVGTARTSFTQYGYFMDADIIPTATQSEPTTPLYWAQMGDSITIQNLWQLLVTSTLNLVPTNLGIAGTKMSGSNSDSMWQDLRVNAIPLNTNVYTVMAGMNDYAQDQPIGTINSLDTETFMGAYNVHMAKVFTRIPAARIFIMGCTFGYYPPSGRPGWANSTTNAQGLNSNDYAEAARQIAKKWNVTYMETNQLGWNQYNANLYTTDNIHPNQLGADRITREVVKEMEGRIR